MDGLQSRTLASSIRSILYNLMGTVMSVSVYMICRGVWGICFLVGLLLKGVRMKGGGGRLLGLVNGYNCDLR